VTSAHEHGMPIPCPEETDGMPHAGIARMALEILYNELSRRIPGTLEPEEQAVKDSLTSMHRMLWDNEMKAVAETGITVHYLIIRPLNPINLPQPAQVAEIRDAIATLTRHGLIARGWGDG